MKMESSVASRALFFFVTNVSCYIGITRIVPEAMDLHQNRADYINHQRHPIRMKKPRTFEGVEGNAVLGYF
jgi:hypothetical protein